MRKQTPFRILRVVRSELALLRGEGTKRVAPLWRGGPVINVDLATSLGRGIYRYGADCPELRLVRELLRPGDTMLDGGANVGLFTLTAAGAVGPSGRVVAVEPSPALFRALVENVRLNRLTNVVAIDGALSTEIGERTFVALEGDAAGLGSFAAVGEVASITVRTSTIDSIVRANIPALIKLDLEGAELLALAGATRTLAARRSAWLVEVEDSHLQRLGGSAQELLALFRDAGFLAQTIGRGPNVLFTPSR